MRSRPPNASDSQRASDALAPRSSQAGAAPRAGRQVERRRGEDPARRAASGRRTVCGAVTVRRAVQFHGFHPSIAPDDRIPRQALPPPKPSISATSRYRGTRRPRRVRAVFDSVAGSYDVMNDLMSFGVHRLWKHFTLSQTGLRPGQQALDVAGGTGDLPSASLRQVGTQGRVVLSDINPAMLERRPRPAARRGLRRQRRVRRRRMPSGCRSPTTSFDCVTIGFGLRNVTDKAAALRSMYRVLKPGGQLLVLEFSKPVAAGPDAGLRRLLVQRAAAARPAGRAGRRQLPLPRRVDPHVPRPGDAARHDARCRLRRAAATTT